MTFQVNDAIVSGSFVLHLLLRPTHWVPSDMDIYIPAGGYRVFRQDLGRLLALTDVPTNFPPGYDGLPVRTVTTAHTGNRIVRFQLIESPSRAADRPITEFHSTLLMNFMAHDHMAVAYPVRTKNGIGILNNTLPHFYGTHTEAVIKYVERGYQMQW